MFIRLFACTDASPMGITALEYTKALCRVAHVRVITMSGIWEGPWTRWSELAATPMSGGFINAVATDPSKWTWLQRVPMTEQDAWQDATSKATFQAGKIEVASARQELHTAGVRNVLFALFPPRAMPELESAKKYDAIIVPSQVHFDWWQQHGRGAKVEKIEAPVTDQPRLRALVLGKES